MKKKDDFDYLAEMLYEDPAFRSALSNSDDARLVSAVAEWLWFNCADIGTGHARDDRMRTAPGVDDHDCNPGCQECDAYTYRGIPATDSGKAG